MIKLTILLKRRRGLTLGEFSDYWLHTHAPKILSLPDAKQLVKSYVQQVAMCDLPDGLPTADFDGMAELWFDDLETAMTIVSSKAYQETIPVDEPNFIDPSATRILITEERRCL